MSIETSRSSRGLFSRIAAIWIFLVLISTVLRLSAPLPGPGDGQNAVRLPLFDDARPASGSTVEMAFWDDGAPADSMVVILLHGSPAASSFMMPLHDALAGQGVRIITPDLPGFEGSSAPIPDYSIRTHAAYLGALLDTLHLPSVHLAGYSMGGGVAIEAMRQWPDRIASTTLIAGIGVQEMELLGEYHLNHGLHGLQLAALWGLINLTPHFGWLDHRMLGLPYARNFYDSDQRPLRSVLNAWEKPLLILHGEADRFVPVAAASEHYRIVPQSEWIRYPETGHGLVISKADRIASDLLGFVRRVENNQASTRDVADPQRVVEASRPFDPSDIPAASGFSLVVLAFLIALATLVSEDLASITAGLMAARGIMPFEWALGGAFAGILLGDIGLYLMGRVLGRRVVTLPPFAWFVSANALERGTRWFEKRGARVIVASRFIPGTRFPTYVAAGIIRAPFWRFLGYFLLGTALWTPFIVGTSTLLGQQILTFWEVYESFAVLAVVGLIVTIWLFVHEGLPLFTHRGRRRWISRWMRLTRWEFWPPWLFYPPVLLRIVRLMVRYRSTTSFTAANPGIESGGFVGESKAKALSLIPQDVNVVARWALVDPASPGPLRETLRLTLKEHGLSLPLVLKPDVGERGHGVHIVRTQQQLLEAATHYPAAFIVQEFVPGEEFGLFYVRQPHEATGKLFSVTRKVLIHLIGNGKHTLERLILDDPRAVCMAPTFLKRHTARLDWVPEMGEKVTLVNVGTHARGALFLNGEELITPTLQAAVDAFAGRMPGFYFGRFDVRVPSVDHLCRGDDLKILEVNGVSSEATHIYDPSGTHREAIRTLSEQWRLAFEIGRANMELGANPTSLRRLLRLIMTWKVWPSFRPDTRAPAEWSMRAEHNLSPDAKAE